MNPVPTSQFGRIPTIRCPVMYQATVDANPLLLQLTQSFGLVSTNPDRLCREVDPVGPENDRRILGAAQESGKVIVAWGVTGEHQGRSTAVNREALQVRLALSQENERRSSNASALCGGRH